MEFYFSRSNLNQNHFMKKNTSLLILAVLFSATIYAQDLPTYVFVSRNAAILGKFGVFPINTNLKTIDITIQSHTIKQL